MHVVMISDHEAIGGAAIAAGRLAHGLTNSGNKVTRIVAYNNIKEKKTYWEKKPILLNYFERGCIFSLKKLSKNCAKKYYNRISHRKIVDSLKILKPDVINLHNIHGASWSLDIIEKCMDFAPVIWTLHDMWSFTGRCAYNYNCMKFLDGCDEQCPTPDEYPSLEPYLIRNAWLQRKELFLEFPDLIAISPSKWLAEEAKKGFWRDHTVEVIPNSIQLDKYKLIDKEYAQKKLNITPKGPILLAAAQNLKERRKGGDILQKALKYLSIKPLTLITFGESGIIQDIDNINIINLGYISEEQKIFAYNAADIFVHTAPVDNLPNTIMESLACGTPIVGFNVGGVPEMVRPNISGWLTAEVSASSLAKTIDIALGDIKKPNEFRNKCRIIAEKEYSQSLQAKRYEKIFQYLISERS